MVDRQQKADNDGDYYGLSANLLGREAQVITGRVAGRERGQIISKYTSRANNRSACALSHFSPLETTGRNHPDVAAISETDAISQAVDPRAERL
jgi:hypothetical protein